jgi:CMP-N,N'-diacetyllegionaminic acid synthase
MKIHLSTTACLIPARKGSKRVTNKNIAIFAGKPLLQWTIDAALKTQLTNIFLTTDYMPKELPFKLPNGIELISRPKEYCQDNSTYDMYIRHFFERYPNFKVVVLLQPTCPLRTSDDIDKAIDQYQTKRSETLVSAYRIKQRHKIYRPNGVTHFGAELRPGDTHLFVRNSAIYIFPKKYFETDNSIFASKTMIYEMPYARSIDIDTQLDFNYAERIAKYKSGGLEDEQEFGIDDINDYNYK